MTKVAIVSIQGLPACYGGFESLAENLVGENCSGSISYTVFCSSKEMPSRQSFHGSARLRYLPFSSHGAGSVIYDTVAFALSIRRYDVVLVLGATGGLFFPLIKIFAKARVILNVDGIEHRRDKWSLPTRMFLAVSERMAVFAADVIISDNAGIGKYVQDHYGRDAIHIAYGGDQALRDVSQEDQVLTLEKYGVKDKDYALSICRIEPENNCHMTLEAFSKNGMELVFVGNWEKSSYGRKLKARYSSFRNIHIVNALYNLDELYALRNNMTVYVHGHSVGGTNPSLVEAMFFGRRILAYDVIYNRSTTGALAQYYSSADELAEAALNGSNESGILISEFAQKHYTWRRIVSKYEALY